jgi:hypothetical protein
MSCEGLSHAEWAAVNEIWTLAAMLENAREDRRNEALPHISKHENCT